MKVWKLSTHNRNVELNTVRNDYYEYQDNFDGNQILDLVKPHLMVFKKGKYYDFPYFTSGIPIFSLKAIDLLKVFLEDNVQFFDCTVENYEMPIKMLNITNLIDAVDYSQSVPFLLLWRKWSGFKKLSFLKTKVSEQHIFKIPESYKTNVYVSDYFRDTVLNSKLKGFVFDEVWNSEDIDETANAKQRQYKKMVGDIEREKGEELDWENAMKFVLSGSAIRCAAWKIQAKTDVLMLGNLNLDAGYSWTKANNMIPTLSTFKWHVAERSDF
ncbi:hypothetical protein A7K91_09655 [Paenibacillus oryzae]|uniref:Immunity MXAN-0049 protein domain-containing protein n=1 Tax=Paenibacillus oryzae TaxID=1844972 RepID=A0A1A5YBK0_9BACL|nr:DUF1629 domain-containing protein [Paenibacillus oryzae]OBR62972.1 hypothetical protein A7K91_09655 [Paenibacillus oryzae]